MEVNSMATAVVVDTNNAQHMRRILEMDGIWDSSRRLQKFVNVVAIPVSPSASHFFTMDEGDCLETNDEVKALKIKIPLDHILKSGRYHNIQCHLALISLPLAKKQLVVSPYQTLVKQLRKRFNELAVPFPEDLEKEIPNVWEKHGDLILLPQSSFLSTTWQCCNDLWNIVASVLGGQRVARKGRVNPDDYRSPRVDLLLGNNGWVEHKDNGIRYTYDVRHCMFSIGNITEKIRVAGFDCTGETVVDLYAGIGYFTLPYLVHAGASLVHACEWNPDAVDALKKNLVLNNVQDRCQVHAGDNKQVCPKGVADRVNLGLIPSSKDGWPVACAALKPQTGGMLHIHGNVTSHSQTKKTNSGPNPPHHAVGSPSGKRTATDNASLEDDDSMETNCEPMERTNPAGLGTADESQFSECSANVVEGSANSRRGESCTPSSDIAKDNQRLELNSTLTAETKTDIQHQSVGAERNSFKRTTGGDEMSKQQNIERTKMSPEVSKTSPEGTEASAERTKSSPERSAVDGCTERSAKETWKTWGEATARKVQEKLVVIHGGHWTTEVTHIEHVKSYAPHVDHIVADIRCVPKN
ncbi:tRNA wybutosine-synthesizing protein 2 homolog isoform X2 [Asterias amurensis]|uniref:tRNA wybutosine-synthesizing protein 2 homolog isoform X2 n=1 Tax=Asterias amurensis TaxID=7602 RepID=UPI003AB34F97